jgi:hypothetical protein
VIIRIELRRIPENGINIRVVGRHETRG